MSVGCCSAWLEQNLSEPPRLVRYSDLIFKLDDERTCCCERPSCLMVKGRILEPSGSLICGDCQAPLPAYAIPPHLEVKSWSDVYAHVSMIDLASGVLESWAIAQLTDLESELNRVGYAIARRAAEHYEVPVYFCFWPGEENQDNTACPRCGGTPRKSPWGNPACLCDGCSLVYYGVPGVP